MNGRIMKRCEHSFKSCNNIPVYLIHLFGKIIYCGIKITYTYVRTPKSKKRFFVIAHLSYGRALNIFKNLPQGQERIFWDVLIYDIQNFVAPILLV